MKGTHLLTRKKGKAGRSSLAVFLAIQVILSIVASGTALAAYIGYDDSYNYEGSSSDGVAWGGSTLKTYLKDYPAGTMVTCLDYCGDGKIDHCYGSTFKLPWESQSPMEKCRADSGTLNGICNAGKCNNGGVGDWQGIGTGKAGDRWTCSIWSRYYYDCKGTAKGDYKYGDTSLRPYYMVSPR